MSKTSGHFEQRRDGRPMYLPEIAINPVRHVGHPVAVVVARDRRESAC